MDPNEITLLCQIGVRCLSFTALYTSTPVEFVKVVSTLTVFLSHAAADTSAWCPLVH